MKYTEVNIKDLVDNLNDEEKFLYEIEDSKFKLIENLIEKRKEKRLTQTEISKITGMSQQAVSRIEKYGYDPSLGNLLKYLKALELDINDIFKK